MDRFFAVPMIALISYLFLFISFMSAKKSKLQLGKKIQLLTKCHLLIEGEHGNPQSSESFKPTS